MLQEVTYKMANQKEKISIAACVCYFVIMILQSFDVYSQPEPSQNVTQLPVIYLYNVVKLSPWRPLHLDGRRRAR